MPALSNLSNIWNNVKEIDLRPIRDEALTLVKIVIVGSPDSGRELLADQMRVDPHRPHAAEGLSGAPVMILDLKDGEQAQQADIIILVLNAARSTETGAYDQEKLLVRKWISSGKEVLVFVNQDPELGSNRAYGPWVDWGQKQVVYAAASEVDALLKEFVPVVIDLLPSNKLLSLGRHFPLFRVAIAHQLINESSFSNAAYSLSTGLAEVVPVFDIPLNVADMVILSKAQAFMVYKLGLALGMSTRWQDYVAEFGSVLGGGFLWRQVARSLVGLIPAAGIIPKVGVAYSGTYVVGNTVLQWYLTGRHISPEQMRELYRQAFIRGKHLAQSLIERVPRPRLGRPRLPALPRLGRRKKVKELPAEVVELELKDSGEPLLLEATSPTPKVCNQCGRSNAADAHFCQYCGLPLIPPQEVLDVES